MGLLVVWCALTLALSGGIPRVVPLDSTSALSILHAWGWSDDLSTERSARLERMCSFAAKPSAHRGTIGMVGPDGYVVAIANLLHPPIVLVDVDAPLTHASYAAVLVQVLLKEVPELSVSDSLDDRWRLACCFRRPAQLSPPAPPPVPGP